VLDVTAVLRPEREELLSLLAGLQADDWRRPTECPAYDVQGIATHVLGDDLSLLSRQRDGAVPGVVALAAELPGVDFATLLNAFNDRWVAASSFLSPALLIGLLRLSGEWTVDYYCSVDLGAPGEPVFLFGSTGGPSPVWHAVAREYMERWVHHAQIRRAVGLPSLADTRFLEPGARVAAAVAGWTSRVDADGRWCLDAADGTVLVLGDAQQAADLLTRAHPADGVRALVEATGPDAEAAIAGASALLGRP
jgi:uncharacterized protein (TIGR03083 family)